MTADKSNRNLLCKKWEKERRGRLNDSFNKLAKLLPCHDPSITISKIEILTKSAEYITKLKTKVDEFFTSDSTDVENKAERVEIKELHIRITTLTSRNEQLASLLKEANIRIPSECGVPNVNIAKTKKWSGKITPQKADEINKLEAQKENKNDKVNQSEKECDKLNVSIESVKNTIKVKKKVKREKPLKTLIKTKNAKLKSTKVTKVSSVLPTLNATHVTHVGSSNLTITNVQPVQPYYIIANNIPTQATTVVKNVISAPILSTTNQSTKTLTGGILLPVVQPQTLINPPLILNTATPSNTLIVLETNKTETAPCSKPQIPVTRVSLNKNLNVNMKTTAKPTPRKLRVLKPKRRLISKLVQSNKVAIPASRYDSSFILWSSPPQPIVKKRIKIIRRKRKKVESLKVQENKVVKKAKLQIQKEVIEVEIEKPLQVENDSAKKAASSDYSIDAICKENETPLDKDVVKVVVDKIAGKTEETLVEKQHVHSIPAPPPINVVQNVQIQQQKELKPNQTISIPTNKQIKVIQENDKITLPKQQNFINERRDLVFQQNTLQTSNNIPKVHKDYSVRNNLMQQQEQQHRQINLQLALPQNQSQKNPSLERVKSKNIVTNNQQHQQSQQILHHNHNHQHTQNPPRTQLQPQQNPEIQLHSELSNDIFASLQVQGSQNPESTSPTAAFLNAFPLVSSFTGVKVTEVMDDETTDSPHGTPTLLQIGNMQDNNAPQKHTQLTSQQNPDNLTPSIMNLDNFNFFNNNLYNNFDNIVTTTTVTAIAQPIITTTISVTKANVSKDVNVKSSLKLMYKAQNNLSHGNMPSTTDVNVKNYRSVDKRNQSQSQKASNTNNKFSYNIVTSTVSSVTTQQQQQPFYDNSQVTSSTRAVVSSGINFNSTSTNRYNEYNTFNPFELPKTTQSFVKNYNETPSYTSNSNCNYNYQPDFNYQPGKNNYYEGNNCNFYNNNAVNTGNAANNSSSNLNNTNKKVREQPAKTMVNWMAPEFSSTTSSANAKVTSYSSDFPQNNYTTNIYPSGGDYQSTTNLTMDANQEHQFPWSPTKLPQLLDAAHNFPPSTLPTLVGDLALGISTYSNSTGTNPSATTTQIFDNKKMSKVKAIKQTQHYEPNFLSVSQLVEPNKEATTARITNRRNSGNRTNSTKQQAHHSKNTPKRNVNVKDKEKIPNKMYELEWDAKRNNNSNSNNNKNVSSYSAESLIGAKQQNYPKTIPPYLPDNLIPYFPPNIDENFSQNNQNYHQTNTFTTNYNNTFIPPPPTSTTYLSTNNFMPDNMFENPIENIFSHSNPTKSTTQGNSKKSPQKPTKDAQYAGAVSAKTKTKKKDTFVDLSFLSMPSMNSPLLPDDYHTNFLAPPPPPTANHNHFYPSCKAPLYKQTSGGDLGILPLPTGSGAPSASATGTSRIQHPEISSAPSSLTNFNLCTIFPEINRTNSVVPDVFRNYGNNAQKGNYLPNLE